MGRIKSGRPLAAHHIIGYWVMLNIIFQILFRILPSRRKASHSELWDDQPESGTKIAYDIAVKKGKYICFYLKKATAARISNILPLTNVQMQRFSRLGIFPAVFEPNRLRMSEINPKISRREASGRF